jgi:hypothetical protein
LLGNISLRSRLYKNFHYDSHIFLASFHYIDIFNHTRIQFQDASEREFSLYEAGKKGKKIHRVFEDGARIKTSPEYRKLFHLAYMSGGRPPFSCVSLFKLSIAYLTMQIMISAFDIKGKLVAKGSGEGKKLKEKKKEWGRKNY